MTIFKPVLNRYYLCIIFSALLVLNCSKEEDKPIDPISKEEKEELPVIENYLTINVRSNYTTEDSDNWVIIYDDNGKLLDYKPFETNDKLEFNAVLDTISEFISVTTMQFYEDVSTRSHEFLTTTRVPRGDEIDFGSINASNSEYQPLINTGEFEFALNNIPGSYNGFNLPKILSTIKRGQLGGSGSGINRNGLHETVMNIPKYEGHDDYIITVLDRNNDLKYSSFNNPQAQNLSLNYPTDFLNFDSYVTVNLPEHINYYFNVAGFDDDQDFHQNEGYWLHSVVSVINNDVPTNPLKIGYLDRFTKYRTQLSIKMEDYSYNISKYGSKLDELIIPEKPNFTIVNPSHTNFDFNVDIDYIASHHRWTYSQGAFENNDHSFTGWSYNAPKGSHVIIGDLPNEIIEKYPTIGFENLEHYSTRFYLQYENVFENYNTTEGIIFYSK